MLLLVWLEPVQTLPTAPSEAFHHTTRPGVWVSRGYGWGPHRVYVDEAGWRTAPPVTADEAGWPDRLRDEAEQPLGLEAAAHGGQAARFRMAVMGDSFVEAVQVAWEDTFVARMQARSAGRTEVLNRANSSYSPLISLLRWQRQVARGIRTGD